MIAGMGRTDGQEMEVDEDGAWRALVTSGERVGRFGGRLGDGDLDDLKEEVAASTRAGAPAREDPWPAGGLVETFWAGEVVAQLAQDEEPDEAWRALVGRCRQLLAAAPGSPLAALEASAAGDGAVRHVGSEPLATDGSGFTVEATLYGPDSSLLGSYATTVPGPGDGVVPPGWEAPLGLSASGLAPTGGQTVGVSVGFALGAGLPRPMSVWAST